jgi:hypothetical protein
VIYIIAIGVVAVVFVIWLIRMLIDGRKLRGMRAWEPPPRHVDEDDETLPYPPGTPPGACA